MIKYHDGVNLFTKYSTMNKNDYIVHSCNNIGVWGAGFAKQLKQYNPTVFKEYVKKCRWNRPFKALAHFDQESDGKPWILSLIVSRDYGVCKDPQEVILENTRELLLIYSNFSNEIVFHSPKINSGLFGVPWEKTEAIIQEFVNKTGCEWNVYSL